MGITIDKRLARTRLEGAIAWALSDKAVPEDWLNRSLLVGEAPSRTYTPMLGTGLLARATDDRVDALALKEASGENAYSARGLCHDVLVPAAVEFGFDIRNTGREPLNNQPFFRYDRVDVAERVRFPEHHRYLVECLQEANKLSSGEALAALAAFLRVCLQRASSAAESNLEGVATGLRSIVSAAKDLLLEDAEGGKRAQAVVAAVFDVIYGPDRVRTLLVNDPSRHFPGDVQALDASGRAIVSAEVRAKAMSSTEVEQLARALARAGITRAMAVALASDQPKLPHVEIAERLATEYGVLTTIIDSVDDLLLNAFAWSTKPLPDVLAEFPGRVVARLQSIDADRSTVERWVKIIRASEDGPEASDADGQLPLR